MQTYFFDFFNGSHWLEDSVGQEIAGTSLIALEAKIALIEISKEYILDGKTTTLMFNVKNEEGKSIYKIVMNLGKENFGFESLHEHSNIPIK